MPIVDIKGVGSVNFPDSMSKEDIQNAIEKDILPQFPEIGAKQKRTWGEAGSDILASLESGAGQLAQLPGQIGTLAGITKPEDAGTGLQGLGQRLEAYGQEQKSAPLKAREALRAKKMQEAEGFVGEFGTAIKSTISDPALLSSFFFEQLPNLVGTGGFGALGRGGAKVLMRNATEEALTAAMGKAGVGGAVAGGAIMQGADVGTDTYNQVYAELKKQDPKMPDEQAQGIALSKGRMAAIEAAGISLAATRLPGGASIERALAGKGLPGTGGFIKGLGGEALSEGVEEGGGALAKNINVAQAIPGTDIMKGVGSAAGLGALGGALLGGPAGMLNARGETQGTTAPPPPAGQAPNEFPDVPEFPRVPAGTPEGPRVPPSTNLKLTPEGELERDLFGVVPQGRAVNPREMIGPEMPGAEEIARQQPMRFPGQQELFEGPSENAPRQTITPEPKAAEPKPVDIPTTVKEVVDAAKKDPNAPKLLKANNPATAKIVADRIQGVMGEDKDPIKAIEQLYTEHKTGKGKGLTDAQQELLEHTYHKLTGRQVEEGIKERAFLGANQTDFFAPMGEPNVEPTTPTPGEAGPNVGAPVEPNGGETAGGTEGGEPSGVAPSPVSPEGPAGGAGAQPVALTPEQAWERYRDTNQPTFAELSPEDQAEWGKLVARGQGTGVNFSGIMRGHTERTRREQNKAPDEVRAALKKYNDEMQKDIESSMVGKSFTAALGFLTRNGPAANRKIAEALLARTKELMKVGYTFTFSVATTRARTAQVGGYQESRGVAGRVLTYPISKRVDISIAGRNSGQSFGGTYDTMTHESTHAVTAMLVAYGENNPTSPTGKIVKKIAALSKHVLDTLKAKEARGEKLTSAEYNIVHVTNALGNEKRNGGRYNQSHEMLAQVMAGSDMKEVLELMPAPTGNKSALTQFVELIRDLLGLTPKSDTALTYALGLTEQLMNVPVASLPSSRGKGVTLESTQEPWAERETPNQFGRESALTDMHRMMREAYDESNSPDEAYNLAYDAATPAEQYILRQLKKDDFLGFDYPHQAIEAILQEPNNYDLSPALKTAISRLGNKISLQSSTTPGPAVVPGLGQPYTLPRGTKTQPAQTAGQKVKDATEKAVKAYNSDDFWTKFRIATVDQFAGLSKTLSSLPVFQDGKLRADMLLRSFTQTINLIKNGLQSGIPMLNNDGTVVIGRSADNLARSQKIADGLDNNAIVKGTGMTGREYVAEVARHLRGEEIINEDKRRRAKAAIMMGVAKQKMAEAKMLYGVGGKFADVQRLVKEAKAIRAKYRGDVKLNREKQTTQAHIEWANQQMAAVPELKEIFGIWRNINLGLLKLWEDTGKLTKEDADRLRSFKNYVPLYAAREDLAIDKQEGYTGAKTGTKTVRGIEYLEGTDLQRNIWENWDKHYASMTAAAFVNQTRKVAVEQLRALGAARVTSATDDNVNLRYEDVNSPDADDNGLVHVIVDNPNDLAAFQAMHYELTPLMKGLSAATQGLRTTALVNPMYWLKQLIRDPLHAALVTKTGVTTPFHSAAEFAKILSGQSEEARILAARGVIGQVDSTIDIHDFLKQAGTQKLSPSALDKALHKIMQIHEASDAATRVALFKKGKADGLKKGMSEQEAIDYGVFIARESINFGMRGNSKTLAALRHMIPFLSASITSLDTLYRAATGYGLNPEEKAEIQRIFYSRAAMMAVLATAYAMSLQDDDDYKKLPASVKDNNWLLPNPWSTDGHSFIKIPVPFEIGFFFKTLPEASVRYLSGNATGKEMLASVRQGIMHNLPGEGILIPQAFKPALETVVNYSFFTGRSIEGMSDQSLPVAERGPNASEVAKMLSSMGLDSIGLSPAKIDHLIQGYMAELGTFTSSVAGDVISAAEGKTPPTKNIEEQAFFKSFMTNPKTSSAATDFYEIAHTAQETVNSFNRAVERGDREHAMEIMSDEEKKKLYAIAPITRQLQNQMNLIRRRVNYIKDQNDRDPDERRDEINELMRRYDAVAKNIYDVMEKAGIER